MKCGFFNSSIGLLFGVLISWSSVVEREGEDMPLGMALAVMVLGIALWVAGLVVADRNGVTVDDLRTVRDLPRFMRSLPFLGNLCVGAGAFLVLANLVGTPSPAPGLSGLFADAESAENDAQQIIRGKLAGNAG